MAVGCGGSPAGPTNSGRVPTLSRTRFLAFGDSLTAGEVTSPVPLSGSVTKMVVLPAASYPSNLLSQLSARYTTQVASLRVVNSGVPAESVIAGAARFSKALSADLPDVVLIMEGVNGISTLGPEVSTEHVRSMVVDAKGWGVRVFVGSMVPTIPGRQRSQNSADLEAYNVRLRRMAAEEGATFVDLYTPLLPEVLSVIGIDGLHPTEAGYRRVAQIYFNAIQASLEVTSR